MGDGGKRALMDAARNLRRIARRIRGESVSGLNGLDPIDPDMVAGVIEHEAKHLELEARGGKTPTDCDVLGLPGLR